MDRNEAAKAGVYGAFDRDLGVASYDYTRLVERAGGIPVVLPVMDEGLLDGLLDRLDGILLTGGTDVNPFYYGEPPTSALGKIEEERDALELALVKRLGGGLSVSACSRDGIVEAVESTAHTAVFAVQWHPEMMAERSASQQRLFDHFVECAIRRN